MTWTDYQSSLLDVLNQKTQGTQLESHTPLQLVNHAARHPEKASLFNHASMALNNRLFFEALSPEKTEPTGGLLKDINSSFDSLENLEKEIAETANAMFGNGFVWLMRQNGVTGHGNLTTLCTYNAGSPFPEAHYRLQHRDMNNHGVGTNLANTLVGNARMNRVQNTAGFIGESSRNPVPTHPNALVATPLLCVNVWQHMWVLDYGVTHKRTYLSNWWNRIDWGVVHDRLNVVDTTGRSKTPNQPGDGTKDVLNKSFNRRY